MKILELVFLLCRSEETCKYLCVSYSLFNVMYLFVSGIQYMDVLCCLQVMESYQDKCSVLLLRQ